MSLALIAGIVLGFVGSIPIAGPISALVLERTLAGEREKARGIGVGAALAEATYATLAFVGVGQLAGRFPHVMVMAKVIGIVVLTVVAVLLVRGRDTIPDANLVLPKTPPERARREFLRGTTTGFGIAILNPTLIATWSTTTAMLFATGWVKLDVPSAIAFAIGTTLGIGTWLVALVSIVSRGAARLGAVHLVTARRIGATFAMLIAFALGVQAIGIVSGSPIDTVIPSSDGRDSL